MLGHEVAGVDAPAGAGGGGRWERLEGLMHDLEELVQGGGEGEWGMGR